VSRHDVGVADTSVLIALETGRELDASQMPDALVTTVITRAELEVGVLCAPDSAIASQRLATLEQLADMVVLPATGESGHVWAQLRARLREQKRRVDANDLWIAAIAVANELPIVTQDADFDALEGAKGVTVIRV